MIKKLIFATGFGVGFVVGSASGRQSYETLKQNALKTWQDPKVQDKVSEGSDWVKAEVPVVGGKLADGARKAADTVGAKASDASSTVKGKVSGASGEKGSGDSSTGYADLQDAKPVTPESSMDPAEPRPAPGDTQH